MVEASSRARLFTGDVGLISYLQLFARIRARPVACGECPALQAPDAEGHAGDGLDCDCGRSLAAGRRHTIVHAGRMPALPGVNLMPGRSELSTVASHPAIAQGTGLAVARERASLGTIHGQGTCPRCRARNIGAIRARRAPPPVIPAPPAVIPAPPAVIPAKAGIHESRGGRGTSMQARASGSQVGRRPTMVEAGGTPALPGTRPRLDGSARHCLIGTSGDRDQPKINGLSQVPCRAKPRCAVDAK